MSVQNVEMKTNVLIKNDHLNYVFALDKKVIFSALK